LLVLLPYILIALAMLNIYQVTEEERQFMRAIKLQGAYGREAFVEGFKWKKGGAEANAANAKKLIDEDRANRSIKKLSKEEYEDLKLRRAEEEAIRLEEEAKRLEEEAEITRQKAELESQRAELERQQAEIASIEETVIVEEPTDEAPTGSVSWWLGG
jgi:hypothetical protein